MTSPISVSSLHRRARVDHRIAKAVCLAVMVIGSAGCGDERPGIPLEFGAHDECSQSLPYTSVDASSSEIQCFIEDYVVSVSEGMVTPPMALTELSDQPGEPVCCEVCAKKGTADEACDATCNWLACDHARDLHWMMGGELGGCKLPDCGFDFEACLLVAAPHVQWIELWGAIDPQDFYLLHTKCNAHAIDPARPDGLFSYLEGLDGVPNAGGSTAEVTDVVQWCIDRTSATGGGFSTSAATTDGSADDGADTTVGDEGGPGAPDPPQPCGPWATQRTGANAPDNFGAWSHSLSEGSWADGTTSFPVDVTSGGIEFTMMPCPTLASQKCLRIDRLTVRVADPASMLAVDINLVERTQWLPVSPGGEVSVPSGALRMGARTQREGIEELFIVSNSQSAQLALDPIDGAVELLELVASQDGGDLSASLSLRGDLLNTQPRPQILVAPGSAWNQVVLSASTVDAELDPITHRWMVLGGHGTYTGDEIEVTLPKGRHAVVLYADDVHGARSVAATWVEITNEVLP